MDRKSLMGKSGYSYCTDKIKDHLRQIQQKTRELLY